MKKIYLCILMVFCLLFCSCESKPNMQTLLAYQNEHTEFQLRIQDGETFSVRLTIGKDGALLLTFEDDERKHISYRQNKDGMISILSQDKEILIENRELLKCKTWFSLFHLSAEQHLWKIKKENLGGIRVFVCQSDGLTLYIDAVSGIPLKWKTDGIEVDNIKKNDAQQSVIFYIRKILYFNIEDI